MYVFWPTDNGNVGNNISYRPRLYFFSISHEAVNDGNQTRRLISHALYSLNRALCQCHRHGHGKIYMVGQKSKPT